MHLTTYASRELDLSLRSVLTFASASEAALRKGYRQRLKALEFPPRDRKLFDSFPPFGSAASADYLGRISGAAWTLLTHEVSSDRILKAWNEWEKELTERARALPSADRTAFRQAAAHVNTAVRATVTATEAELSRRDMRLMEELLRTQELAYGRRELCSTVLRILADHCSASSGVMYLRSGRNLELAGEYNVTGSPPVPAPQLARTLISRAREFTPEANRRPELILLPGGRRPAALVWSIPGSVGLLQLGFTAGQPLAPHALRIAELVFARCRAALLRLERESRLHEDSLRMLEVEELERRRIARELHDDAGQSLVVVRLQMEMAEMALPPEADEARNSLSEIRELTERIILGLRKLISDLSPPVLEQLGLAAAVRQLTNRFSQEYPGVVRLKVGDLPVLSPSLEMVIYRILQECFANISQHSGAEHVNVSISATDREIRLSVEDDGVGFDVAEGLGRRNCFGLLGIRERAHLLDGEFTIDSHPATKGRSRSAAKRGTKVNVRYPLTGDYPNS